MTLQTLLDRFDLLMDTPESVFKLRQFILRLAISGRLTNQKPDDTHAEVLLEQVLKEKQRLYDRGGIRKPKSFEPLEKEQQPFPIPETWKWTRIGEIRRGWGRKEPDKPFPYLDVSSINKENGEISDEYDILPPEEAPSRARKRVRPGTVIYSSVRPYLLNIAIVDDRFDLEPIASTAFVIVHPLGEIEEKYVYYYLRSAPMVEYVEDQMAGMAYPSISKTKFLPAPFPLPPPEEQKRIIETVDGLMDECDALEEQQEHERTLQVQVRTSATEALQSADDAESLRPAWERIRKHFDTVTATPEGVDALRQTILQLAVQGRLTERDPDDTPADVLLEEIQQEKQRLYDAGEIRKPKTASLGSEKDELPSLPGGWRWACLADLITQGPRNGYSPKTVEYETDTKRLDLTATTSGYFQDGYFEYVDEEIDSDSPLWLKPGDILIQRGNSIDYVGIAAVYDGPRHEYIYPDLMMRVKPSPPVNTWYLHSVLISGRVRSYYRSNASGTSGNMPKINQGVVLETPIPLPPSEEQQRIVETIDRIVPLCDDLSSLTAESNEHGERLFKAALEDVTGSERDCASIEVAS